MNTFSKSNLICQIVLCLFENIYVVQNYRDQKEGIFFCLVSIKIKIIKHVLHTMVSLTDMFDAETKTVTSVARHRRDNNHKWREKDNNQPMCHACPYQKKKNSLSRPS